MGIILFPCLVWRFAAFVPEGRHSLSAKLNKNKVDNLGYNTGYIEELYSQFLKDPNSVSPVWREFFKDYQPEATTKAVVQATTAYETAVANQ